jgi:hypothetical protein
MVRPVLFGVLRFGHGGAGGPGRRGESRIGLVEWADALRMGSRNKQTAPPKFLPMASMSPILNLTLAIPIKKGVATIIAKGLSSRPSRLPAPSPPRAGVIPAASLTKLSDGNQAGLLCGFSNKCPSPHYNTLFGPRGSFTRPQPPHLLVI